MADYILNVPCDSYLTVWNNVVASADTFLRRFTTEVTDFQPDLPHLFTIINHMLKVHNFHTFKVSHTVGT